MKRWRKKVTVAEAKHALRGKEQADMAAVLTKTPAWVPEAAALTTKRPGWVLEAAGLTKTTRTWVLEAAGLMKKKATRAWVLEVAAVVTTRLTWAAATGKRWRANGEDYDDKALASLAALGVGAYEEVWAGVGEDEAGVTAVEAQDGVGGVTGVVVALGHPQHAVHVLVVPEYCHKGTPRHSYSLHPCIYTYVHAKASIACSQRQRLTECVVDLESVALGPVVVRLAGVRCPPVAAADVEVARRAATRRQGHHQEQDQSRRSQRPCHHRHHDSTSRQRMYPPTLA